MPRTDAAVGDESRSAEAAAAAPPRPHCRPPPLGLRKHFQHEGGEEEKNYQIATHCAGQSDCLTTHSACLSLSLCLIGAFLQFLATRKEERSVPSAKEGVLPNGGEEGIGPHPTLNSARRAGRGRLRTGSIQ